MAAAVPIVVPTVAEAATAFLDTCTAPSTRRSYTQTMTRLIAGHGTAPVTALDGETLRELLTTSWSGAAPSTWNRHLATLGSFTAYAVRRRWLEADPATGLQRRKEIIDRTRSIDPAALQRLFDLRGVRLRERTLWRMLYETAARAEEILTLDIGDLDPDDKRARIRAKGGAIEYVFWQTGTARLLPRLIDGRGAGPLFLADRRPAPARTPATADICPVTGRGRLSYQRAEYLFKQASLRVTGSGRPGWSLHRLRHSALTHLGASGRTAVELQAKSRHTSLRTLGRYVNPGPELAARVTAETDPAARRRG